MTPLDMRMIFWLETANDFASAVDVLVKDCEREMDPREGELKPRNPR